MRGDQHVKKGKKNIQKNTETPRSGTETGRKEEEEAGRLLLFFTLGRLTKKKFVSWYKKK